MHEHQHRNLHILSARLSRFAFTIIVGAIFLLLPACKGAPKTPPPLAAPPATARVDHFVGTPLSGPTTQPATTVDPSSALAVTVEFLVTDDAPNDGLTSLGAGARLVGATRGGAAVMPSPRLTRGAAFATAEQSDAVRAQVQSAQSSGRAVALAELRGALPTGATVVFEAVDQSAQTDALTGQAIERGVQVLVARAAAPGADEQIQVAVVVEDLTTDIVEIEEPRAPVDPEQQDEAQDERRRKPPPPPKAPPQLRREFALLDRLPLEDANHVALVVPFRFTGADAKSLIALVSIERSPADPEAHRLAAAQASKDLAASVAKASASVAPSESTLASAGWQRALAIIATGGPDTRKAILYLSEQTGANLCADVALVADDNVLASLSQGIATNASAAGVQDKAAIGWMFDSTALSMLVRMLTKNEMRPELSSVFALHAGEVSRHGDSIEDVTRGAASARDLQDRLVSENTNYLEDSSPASRVRAFDWLSMRGLAPQGYDPLAPPKSRREALERAALPATAPSDAATAADTIRPGDSSP